MYGVLMQLCSFSPVAVLQVSKAFRDKIESIAKKMNDTITPPMTKAYQAWDKLSRSAAGGCQVYDVTCT
jgi:hypothetical protein